MRRGLWFIAGAGAGVYGMNRARRAAEALTSDGLRDRLSGLALGARLVREEFTVGAVEQQRSVRRRLGLPDTDPPRPLDTKDPI